MRKVLFLALVVASGSAFAQTAFWTGDTTGDPTFNRPESFSSLSASATAVPYEVQPFWVTASGQYVFEADAQTGAGFNHPDTYILVYSGSFNALSGLTNLIAGDDDFSGSFTLFSGTGGGFESSRIALGESSNYGGATTGLNLTANTQYYAVVTGFGNVDFGTYQAAIGGGQGTVNLGVVPEPATMAVLGLGLLPILRRRRRKAE